MLPFNSRSSGLVERHLGYTCCKCQSTSFEGRRYSCWKCFNYQLCGSCYDSGELPIMRGHEYYHPLDVYYTRTEYELYFGGEPYNFYNVPQSYKCALCDIPGFDLNSLNVHIHFSHSAHKDFDAYADLLNTGLAVRAATRAPNLPTPQLPNMRTAMRRNRLNMANMLDELRNTDEPNYDVFSMWGVPEQYIHYAQLRKAGRLYELPPSALRSHFPKHSNSSRSQSPHYSTSIERQQNNPNFNGGNNSSYADIIRGIINEEQATMNNSNSVNTNNNNDKSNDSQDNNPKKPTTSNNGDDSHKFLCAKFRSTPQGPTNNPQQTNRGHFIEAILCSMLAEEHLDPVAMQPAPKYKRVLVKKRMAQNIKEAKPNTTKRPPDGGLERFYRGLNMYKQCLDDSEASQTSAKPKSVGIVVPRKKVVQPRYKTTVLIKDSSSESEIDTPNEPNVYSDPYLELLREDEAKRVAAAAAATARAAASVAAATAASVAAATAASVAAATAASGAAAAANIDLENSDYDDNWSYDEVNGVFVYKE